MQKAFLFVILFHVLIALAYSQSTEYLKTYYSNGLLESEGWSQSGKKDLYWKFYYADGNLKKEGHYKNGKPNKYWCFYRQNGTKESEGHFAHGKKQNWWIVYNKDGTILSKCQFNNDLKDGFCFLYKNKKPVKAEKYEAGKKIKEWNDIKSFKKENKLSDFK